MSLHLATLLLEKANFQERKRSWTSALSLYEEGVAELLKILKVDPDNQRIRHHAEDFLEKAENCKKEILLSRNPVNSCITPGRSGHLKPIRKSFQSKSKQSESAKALQTPSKKQGKESDLRFVIDSEILERSPNVSVNDIIGLDQLKLALYEAIVLPKLQPAIFSGLRKPPKAILLFGPPGNGKTMIAKAIATESKCTFFSISSSSLTSKWVGQGEKLVRTLFESAAENQPAVIFIDEIDSILSTRGASSEHEASRRMKTEFLIRFDGVISSDRNNVLLIAATNLPHELDEAVLRRFSRRFHICQPDLEARRRLICLLLQKNNHAHSLSDSQMSNLAKITEGYSSSDLTELCKEAAMWPVRELDLSDVSNAKKIRKLHPISFDHFSKALSAVKKSVSLETVNKLTDWDKKYGTDLSSVKSCGDCKMS